MTTQLASAQLFLILLQLFLPGLTTEDENFISASTLHEEMCEPPNDCCGFCSMDPDCVIYGSCCLGMHESFEEAKLSVESTRYKCVLPQLITSSESTMYPTAPDVEPVWMITRCDPIFGRYLSRYGIKELCENTGFHDSIEILLPVKVSESPVYRNIFCAFCNGIDLLGLRHWRVEIHCDEMMTATDEDLVNTIRSRGCNIFYKPPWFESASSCSLSQYRINNCTEGGLMSEAIMQACESFVDPFNHTYRNYFCYLCSFREFKPQDDWYCPEPLRNLQETQQSSQVYTTTADIIDLLTQHTNKKTGCDLYTQFLDYKLKICRDKLCHPERLLKQNECKLKDNLDLPRPCVSVFIKMIALEGNLSSGYNLDEKSELLSFLNDMHTTLLHNGIPDRYIPEIDIFVDSSRYNKESTVNYFILKVLIEFESGDPDDVLQKLLLHIHQKSLRLRYRQTLFFFELETYKEVFQGTNKRFIHVPEPNTEDYIAMEWLGKRDFMRTFTFCTDKEAVIPMHKIQVCPYIQIRTEEVSVNVQNEFLILKTHSMTTIFSQFEYELQNDTINVCLSDFLPFFYTLSTPTAVSKSETVDVCKEMLQIIALTMCLKVSL